MYSQFKPLHLLRLASKKDCKFGGTDFYFDINYVCVPVCIELILKKDNYLEGLDLIVINTACVCVCTRH